MKIIYFYQYYSTPNGSWGTRVHEFAKRWVAEGHEVTVVTSIYYKSDLKASKLIENQKYDGVNVKVLNIEINNKHGLLKRIWTFILYSILSSWYALTLKADIVIASSGPITVGIPGLVARYFRNRKLVFEVRDLWPEGMIELGIVKNRIVIKLAYAFEKFCYSSSNLIITLSPGMSDWIKNKYGYTNTISIPNSCDNVLFGNYNESEKILLPEWSKKIHYALYTGNIGIVNNSILLLNTAKLIQDSKINNIRIVLIGDGKQKAMLEEKARSWKLETIIFKDLIPKKNLVVWVQNALCSLVPLKGTPVLDTSSPNKLFDSFASGVPVIQTTNGWIKDILENEQCGFTIDANNPQDLIDKLKFLVENPFERKEMGKRGKRLSIEVFDKNILSKKMISGLQKVHDSNSKVIIKDTTEKNDVVREV